MDTQRMWVWVKHSMRGSASSDGDHGVCFDVSKNVTATLVSARHGTTRFHAQIIAGANIDCILLSGIGCFLFAHASDGENGLSIAAGWSCVGGRVPWTGWMRRPLPISRRSTK